MRQRREKYDELQNMVYTQEQNANLKIQNRILKQEADKIDQRAEKCAQEGMKLLEEKQALQVELDKQQETLQKLKIIERRYTDTNERLKRTQEICDNQQIEYN